MKERIIQIRKIMGLTQEEFGNKIGLARTGVAGIENGSRVIHERHIKLILSAFPGISEKWFRTGQGEMLVSKDDEASRLVERYGFSDLIGRLLSVYEDLSSLQQEAVLEYARKLIVSFMADAEIEKKVNQYRNELLSEKRESSALLTGEENIV